MKRFEQVACIIVIILTMTPVTTQTVREGTSFTPSASFTSLTIDFGNGTVQTHNRLEASNVYNLTIEYYEVDAVWSGNLVFINAIDGVYGDENQGWQYWVNDNYATVSANQYILHDGDSVLWNLTTSNYQTADEPDYSLIVGSVFLTVGGLVFLFVLYFRSKRRY